MLPETAPLRFPTTFATAPKGTMMTREMGLPEEWLRHAPKPRLLGKGEKWNVFLSYRSVNRIWVLNLYDVLHQQGFEVFLDQVVLAGGDELIRVLEDGLQQSQAGVLVWSARTGESDWVRREYQPSSAKRSKGRRSASSPYDWTPRSYRPLPQTGSSSTSAHIPMGQTAANCCACCIP